MIECTMIRGWIIHRNFFGYSGVMFTRVEFLELRSPCSFVPVFGPESRDRHWSCRHSENGISNQVAFPIQNSTAMRRVKRKSIFTPPQCFGDLGSLTSLVHPAILNQLSPHLAPNWEPNFPGGGYS